MNFGYDWVPGDEELSSFRSIVGMDVAMNKHVTTGMDVLHRWEPQGDGIGDNLLDAAGWAKFKVGPMVISANVLIPINDNDGLRADHVWFIGLESTF